MPGSRWSIVFAAALAGPLLLAPHASRAQDAVAYPAALHAGDCDVLGDELARLTPAQVPAGERVGADAGVAAAQSPSSLPFALADLTAADHALAVYAPGDPGTVLACGALGGVLDASGSLVVGLLPESGGKVSGVAYLSPSDAGTAASLFVVDPAADRLAPSPTPGSSPQEATGTEAASREAPNLCAPTTLPTAEAEAALADAGGNPIFGRIGTTRAEFEARFGPGTPREARIEREEAIDVEIPGCATISARFLDGYLSDLFVASPDYADPAPNPWSLEQAERISARLIPLDARLEAPNGGLDWGFVRHPGYSDTLAATIPPDLYAYVDGIPVQGQFETTYSFAELGSDEVGYLSVSLSVEEPAE